MEALARDPLGAAREVESAAKVIIRSTSRLMEVALYSERRSPSNFVVAETGGGYIRIQHLT